MPDIRLSLDDISMLRQLLGQVAPTSDGNVSKLRAKLYGPLDGMAVSLARQEVRFLRDLLDGIVPVDDDDRPIQKPKYIARIVTKLTKALAAREAGRPPKSPARRRKRPQAWFALAG